MNRQPHFIAAVLAALAATTCVAQEPVGTAFTYQGQLKQNGQPAEGPHDFVFTLFDADMGGSPIGTPQTLTNVNVTSGLFTVQLNGAGEFGPNAFSGQQRWLEITVEGSALSPRQKVTATPYALYALNSPVPPTYWAANGNSIFSTNTGNVGIGTAGPVAKLHISGDFHVAGPSALGAGTPVRADAALNLGGVLAFNGSASPTWDTNTFHWQEGGFGARYDSYQHRFDVGGARTEAMRIDASGNVGIGTIPNAELHVHRANADSRVLVESDASGQYSQEVHFRDPTSDWFVGNRWSEDARGFGIGRTNQKNDVVIASDGNVGIGTTSPLATLDISGTIGLSAYGAPHVAALRNSGFGYSPAYRALVLGSPSRALALNYDPAGNPGGGFTGDGRDIVVPNLVLFRQANSANTDYVTPLTLSDGNVGIGTPTPVGRLHIVDGPNWTSHGWKKALALNEGSVIDFGQNNPNVRFGMGSSNDRFYLFSTTTEGTGEAPQYRLVIDSAGNVGIGTGVPQAKLHVNGTARVGVLEVVGGADIAEPFTVSERDEIQPGMLVSIDPDTPGRLRLCRTAYDRTVAGVVSGAGGVKTGLTLRQEGTVADGATPVALSGRVYVWCDAEAGGAIAPGDSLTTSDTAGYAMKVGDFPRAQGAIVGKAMSRLESGRGLVLALVSLQ